MIEINLIPDVKQELLHTQRMRAVVTSISIIASIIAGAVVTVLILYVFAFQTGRNLLLDRDIDTASKKIQQVEDLDKTLTIQNQLKEINNINASKNIDSRLYDVIAAVTPSTPNDAQFSLLAVEHETGTIRLEGQTRDYGTMETFKKTLESAIIEYREEGVEGETQKANIASDISTSDISYGKDESDKMVLRFTVSFKYFEKLFAQNISILGYKLSIDGNVTDSYLGVPRSLFTERAKDIKEDE